MRLLPKFIAHALDKCNIYYMIHSSHLFDEEWYLENYPDVANSGKSPLAHYLKYGYRMGYDPSEGFSTDLYYKAYPEVKACCLNPLVHYLKEGKRNGLHIFGHKNKEEVDRQWLMGQRPFLSIIIPNYNHAEFLQKRLESVYNQNYDNFEVILMDDKSSDNSVSILKEYADRYPEKTVLLLNEENSGSPFAQWRKGIEAAKGDFIWIAESDDWCDKNFTEVLLPEFSDESVMLAFSRSSFMKNDKVIWTIEEYLNDISGQQFCYSFKKSAHMVVKEYFSKKNIIPNVSSCIFRRPVSLKLFEDAQWNHMKVCGDWIFYLHLIRGGYIAYSTKTTNYYRQHETNTSVSLHKKNRYYEEHQIVREHLAKLYVLEDSEINWMVENLRNFWKNNRVDYSDEMFSNIFVSDSIVKCKNERLPNVAICSYAFSTGGGEKVPIDIANALKNAGVAVSFIDCCGTARNEKIRKTLKSDIPVLSLGWEFMKINDMFSQLGVEYVHSHHASVDCSIATCKKIDFRHVVTLHGMYEETPDRYLKEQIPMLLNEVYKWLYIADKNIPVMVKYGADLKNFKKVFNAVPSQHISKDKHEILQQCCFDENAIILAIASRAIPEKGWQETYDSVSRVRTKTGKNVCVIFIGDGPMYEKMNDGSEKWANFVGYSDEVASYFNAADIIMLPSTYPGESFPLCILEAFQAGKPVIATNIGEIPNMLTTSEGVAGRIIPIVKNHPDIAALDDAIEILVNKGDEYKSAVNAACLAAKKFSMDNLVKELLECYK